MCAAKKSGRKKKAADVRRRDPVCEIEEDPLEEAAVHHEEVQPIDATWDLAEFRRRYLLLQHKYLYLEKNFASKVMETSNQHCAGIDKVGQDMKSEVAKLRKETRLICRKKDEELSALKQSTGEEIESLKRSLGEARDIIVQYETRSVHEGVSVEARPTQKSVMMVPESNTSGHGSHDPLTNARVQSNPIELTFSSEARQQCKEAAMEIDQDTVEGVEVVDLSRTTGQENSLDRRTSLQTLRSWSGLNQQDGISLRNEWTYDVEQLDCETFAKLKLGPVEERASWGVELCPEKRYVRCDGDIEISLQAIPHHRHIQTPAKSVHQQNDQSADAANLSLSYSMKKSPIKSRAAEVMSSVGDRLSKAQSPGSSLATYRSMNLGILPDLATLGFKCHRVSDQEVMYQHVLTKDAFSLLCEDFHAENAAEIAYNPIKCHRLRNFLPEFLTEDQIMFQKHEIDRFAQLIRDSVFRCCTEGTSTS